MKTKKLPWIKEEPKSPEYLGKEVDLNNPVTYLKSLQKARGSVPMDFSKEEVQKNYKPYVMNRFISMNADMIIFVNAVNAMKDVPHDKQYAYYDSLGVMRDEFHPYLKNQNGEMEKKKQTISKYYECGTKDSNLAYKLLTDEQKDSVISVFDVAKPKR